MIWIVRLTKRGTLFICKDNLMKTHRVNLRVEMNNKDGLIMH